MCVEGMGRRHLFIGPRPTPPSVRPRPSLSCSVRPSTARAPLGPAPRLALRHTAARTDAGSWPTGADRVGQVGAEHFIALVGSVPIEILMILISRRQTFMGNIFYVWILVLTSNMYR